jgi:hypothetical protein
MNQHIETMVCPRSSAKVLKDRYPDYFFNGMRRGPLLAMVFGIIIVIATGCSSTGAVVKAGLIAPATNNQQGTDSQEDGWYHPPRSPGFNDLTGS